jgi:hypothetical protein
MIGSRKAHTYRTVSWYLVTSPSFPIVSDRQQPLPVNSRRKATDDLFVIKLLEEGTLFLGSQADLSKATLGQSIIDGSQKGCCRDIWTWAARPWLA